MIRFLRNLFMPRQQYFCVLCEKLHLQNNAEQIQVGNIGICSSCMSLLHSTGKCSSFEGTRHIQYILSPYYYEGAIKNAIYQYKFHGMWAYSDIFAQLMIRYLQDYTHIQYYDAIIPVPLSKSRYHERGYNQSALLAEKISAYYGIPCPSEWLTRIRDTQRQSGLKGLARYENVRNAFSANPQLVENKRIILLDDIMTSGCTMEACAETLKRSGAKEVVGLTLAYVYHEKYKHIFM